MTKKLVLTNIADDPRGKKYVFASYLKTDYIDKSLVIYTDVQDNVFEMIFSSNNFGIAEWEAGRGIKDCHNWEDEDSAKSASYLSRRYTAIVSNGNVTEDYAVNKIIADVLSHIEDRNFSDLIFSGVTSKSPETKINIGSFALALQSVLTGI